jgi:DtxR family Mn-dependent transcriptional regulator
MASRPTETVTDSPDMLSSTVENYLKHLYVEQHATGGHLLPMGRVAQALGVTPGTATTMVKALADSGLVDYEPRDGVRLTAAGERHALNVIRRHRLVELFLVRELGLDWSEVHDEAEELEHAISNKVLNRIDELLGHPQFDPHGDPIPGAKGQLASPAQISLAECELHKPMRIARVTGQDPAFLQTLHRLGLTPNTEVVVEARDKLADSVTIRPKDQPVTTLGTAAASKILVENG